MLRVLLEEADDYLQLLTAYMGEQSRELKLSARAQHLLKCRLKDEKSQFEYVMEKKVTAHSLYF